MSETQFRIEIEGLEERIARLNGNLVAIVKAADQGIAQGMQFVAGEARLNLSGRVLHVQTGRLRQSIQALHEKGSLAATVGTNVVYAKIHELGGRTKAHPIVVKNARALGPFIRRGQAGVLRFLEAVGPGVRTKAGAFTKRFTKSAAGRGVLGFARSVQHPGSLIPARPYMRPALTDSVPRIRQTFTSLVAEALTKAGA